MKIDKSFSIAGRQVGGQADPLVIAEIGINHGGSLDVAIEMVDAAHRAGVEVVKHQTHVIEDEMSAAAQKVIPGNSDKSIYQIMAECALNEKDEKSLMDHVSAKGMIFISTPFSRAAALRLERFGVQAYKIGSGECNNYPLLKLVASYGKPIILSTGMNNLSSVAKAVQIFESAHIPYALLHTTNLYPTPHHLVRLGAMTELMSAFQGVPVGLSDHTVDNYSSYAAIALGASIIEKHFTDHHGRHGPDISCSMDESACRELITAARIIRSELGGTKEAAAEERVTIDFAFASVVTTQEVHPGEVLNEHNLWVKRPGKGGIPAEAYESILGKRATRYIASDTQLQPGDYE
jgi:N-acetylneuraminate synthase